ncbi:hypothetical protein [Taklimakanibacter albus]|uniref:Uncharacterized protein n=1 Tax=Taklimakanibacter albus TaxID=2800327 RepID=A0ACC5RG18_9HYPH|nr:hypothetical protein [Aestuariivirga sp. YIM B02566]MBK1871545.1 hypothetical protein [Aestuariivirga sp. YIM B02566]
MREYWDYIRENWLFLLAVFLFTFIVTFLLQNSTGNSMRLLDEPPSGCVEVAAPFQGGSE